VVQNDKDEEAKCEDPVAGSMHVHVSPHRRRGIRRPGIGH